MGKEWNEVASRKFLGAYLDYEERLQIANQEGGVRHTQVPVGHMIPAYIVSVLNSYTQTAAP